MWDNCKAVKREDGNYQILVDYQFRDTIPNMFPESNLEAATKHARGVVKKAENEGLTEILENEIESRVKRGVLKELSEEEVEEVL